MDDFNIKINADREKLTSQINSIKAKMEEVEEKQGQESSNLDKNYKKMILMN